MNRFKLFIENFIVYGLTGIIGKAIPLIMLPIVTRLIPDTSVYGAVDILRVLASFGSAFAILGMYDAMFRLFFERDSLNFKKSICSSALIVVIISSLITSFFVILFSKNISILLFDSTQYYFWVRIIGIQISVSSLANILKAPTRIQNRRKVFVFISFLAPLISYSISIPVIIYIDPFAGLISGAFGSILFELIFFGTLNKKWFNLHFIDKNKAKDMLKIGLPLLPTFLIYWIFSSFDRIMISSILGTEQNGIYAIGAKMGQISNLIYTAFAGGWQYFAFSTMKDQDQVELNSKVFEYLGIISFSATIFIKPFISVIFNLLFTGDYVLGYQVAPYLFISPLLLMLFQTAGNQLLIIKKTIGVPLSLTVGAILNIALNYYLIPILGIKGAALATLIGYSISVILICIITKRLNLFQLKKRFLFSCLLFLFFFTSSETLILGKIPFQILLSIFILSTYIFLYKKEIKFLLNKISNKPRKNKRGVK